MKLATCRTKSERIAMDQSTRFERFRALHERPGIFLIPNPWDAGSAKILTSLGFEALATTSAGFAFSMGKRDEIGGLGRDAVLENARAIVESTHLPVSADLADGFGREPKDCAETIRRAAVVGLAGASIEDATGDHTRPVYELALAVERIVAAAESATANGVLLTARAEEWLYGANDLDATIARLQAYADAGADVLYAPGLPDLDAIRRVCSSVPKPVNVLMGLKGATFTVDELADAGVKRISVGGSLARAALGALLEAAREMLDHGTFTYSARALPSADVERLLG
jgi:2-methylisocitrate lyase-like PEP mutase family enzyme